MVSQKVDFDKELRDINEQTGASIAHLRSLGLKLPDTILDMSDWLTIKRYAEKYNLSQQVVVNWIGRGVIPGDCVQVVPELNDMKLVKDRIYK
ncbi:hypothetical protein GCM10028806_08880 [Spirosoma terrae]|uniref:Uncharacterized protein n=1 Tax=Spirosoma terrae TaxID=1968276 RepID=A0A6L9L9Z7_9BACT|nr:hypothetical protein [Spirosoma terrae]NDU95971.1 hypothetical protein [Spirosoma terrae]